MIFSTAADILSGMRDTSMSILDCFTILYDKYVKAPQNNEELEQHMQEFILAGMPGAFASMDATHIIHEMCRWKSRRAHMGHKSKHATRTFNLMANHRRRILGSTRGNPGSFNEQVI